MIPSKKLSPNILLLLCVWRIFVISSGTAINKVATVGKSSVKEVTAAMTLEEKASLVVGGRTQYPSCDEEK